MLEYFNGYAMNSWEKINALEGGLRLKLAMKFLSDDRLIAALKKKRGRGRNDYPISKQWKSLLASLCAPSLKKSVNDKAASASASSRFLSQILAQNDLLQEMQANVVGKAHSVLPKFGTLLALGRIPFEASSLRLDYVLDAVYGLPIAAKIASAKSAAVGSAEDLLVQISEKHPEMMQDSRYLIGDASYDDAQFIAKVWDCFRLNPIIALSPHQKLDLQAVPKTKALFDANGSVFCVCPVSGEKHPMVYCGYEKKRGALKYKCMSTYYGSKCKGFDICQAKSGARVPLALDRRVFTSVARSSYKWNFLYSTLERSVNFRQHITSVLKRHRLRDKEKLHLLSSLTMSLLLSLFLAIQKKRGEKR